MQFDWKAFAVGCTLAAISGALTYAQVLPGAYGAVATALVTMLAHWSPPSLKLAKSAPDEEVTQPGVGK